VQRCAPSSTTMGCTRSPPGPSPHCACTASCFAFPRIRFRADDRPTRQRPASGLCAAAQSICDRNGLRCRPYNDPYASLQTVLRDLTVAQAQQWSRGAGVRIAIIDTASTSSTRILPAGDCTPQFRRCRRVYFPPRSPWHRGCRRDCRHRGQPYWDRRHRSGCAPPGAEGVLAGAPRAARLPRATASRSPRRLGSAIDMQADVVNLSLAGPADPLLARLLQQVCNAAMIFVGAAPPRVRRPVSPRRRGSPFRRRRRGVIGCGRQLLAPAHEVLTLVPVATGISRRAAPSPRRKSPQPLRCFSLRGLIFPHRALTGCSSASSQNLTTHDVPLVSVNACAALADLLQRGGCGSVRAPVASTASSAAPAAPAPAHANVSN